MVIVGTSSVFMAIADHLERKLKNSEQGRLALKGAILVTGSY